MQSDELLRRVEALERVVADLALRHRTENSPTVARSKPVEAAPARPPSWTIIALANGIVLSGDWESAFRAATTRYLDSQPFSGGGLLLDQWQHKTPILAEAVFDVQGGYTVPYYVYGEGWGTAKVKLNGQEVSFNGSGVGSLELVPGRNHLIVMKDKDVDRLRVRVKAF